MGIIFCGKHHLLTWIQVSDPGPMGPLVFSSGSQGSQPVFLKFKIKIQVLVSDFIFYIPPPPPPPPPPPHCPFFDPAKNKLQTFHAGFCLHVLRLESKWLTGNHPGNLPDALWRVCPIKNQYQQAFETPMIQHFLSKICHFLLY